MTESFSSYKPQPQKASQDVRNRETKGEKEMDEERDGGDGGMMRLTKTQKRLRK